MPDLSARDCGPRRTAGECSLMRVLDREWQTVESPADRSDRFVLIGEREIGSGGSSTHDEQRACWQYARPRQSPQRATDCGVDDRGAPSRNTLDVALYYVRDSPADVTR